MTALSEARPDCRALAADLLGIAEGLARCMPRHFRSAYGGRFVDTLVGMIPILARLDVAEDGAALRHELAQLAAVADLMLDLATERRFLPHRLSTRAALALDTVSNLAAPPPYESSAVPSTNAAPSLPRQS